MRGGCAGDVQVTRLLTPAEATKMRTSRLRAVAVARDGERLPIGAASQISDKEVRWEARGRFKHTLEEGDVLETDDKDHVTGLRTRGGTKYTFAPGTGRSPAGTDLVTGVLAGEPKTITLLPRDRIVLEGSFAPGEAVPGGGRIETRRSTEMLVLGIIVLGLG